MSQLFLLLRNNQETGPYTIEQLLQQRLMPRDLVWIDGESTAWSYPSEIETLQRHIHQPGMPDKKHPRPTHHHLDRHYHSSKRTERTESRQKPRAARPDELDYRAEALRTRAQTFAPQHHGPLATPSGSGTLYYNATPGLTVTVHKRHKKTVSLFQLLLVGLVTAGAVLVWQGKISLINVNKAGVQQALPVSIQQEPQPKKPVTAQSVMVATEDSLQMAQTSLPATPKAGTPAKVIKEAATKESLAVVPDTPVIETAIEKTEVVTTAEAPVLVREEASPEISKPTPDSALSEPAEKKKTLGQAIKGLFKKKKKTGEETDSLPDTE